MDLSQAQLDLVRRWHVAKNELDRWKVEEATLRAELVKAVFNQEKEEGTETVTIQEGWKLKATKNLNYNLSNKDGQVTALVSTWPAMANLVRWTPELNVSEYKKLDSQTKEVFNGCLSIKPGLPSLEVAPPKDSSK